MNTTMTHIKKIAAGALVSLSLVGGIVFTAFADEPSTTATSTSATAIREALVTRAKSRGDDEITRRLNSLNAQSARMQAMKRLSLDEKTSMASAIQAQIDELMTLKGKIDSDSDGPTLKDDIQSITKSYRVFALLIPQNAILAAVDRIETMVNTANTLGAKIEARINAAQESGRDVSAAETAYADFQTKIADADVQAKAAASEVSSLQPDNGDTTVRDANTAALKDARSKIEAARKDLVGAREDVRAIVKELAKFGGDRPVSNTGATSTTPTGQE